jgi:hypothetical protein
MVAVQPLVVQPLAHAIGSGYDGAAPCAEPMT